MPFGHRTCRSRARKKVSFFSLPAPLAISRTFGFPKTAFLTEYILCSSRMHLSMGRTTFSCSLFNLESDEYMVFLIECLHNEMMREVYNYAPILGIQSP